MKITSHKKHAELSIRMTEGEAFLLYNCIKKGMDDAHKSMPLDNVRQVVADFSDTISGSPYSRFYEDKEEAS